MLLFCCHSLFERVRLSVNNTFGLFFTKLSHGFRQVDKVKKGINVIFFLLLLLHFSLSVSVPGFVSC